MKTSEEVQAGAETLIPGHRYRFYLEDGSRVKMKLTRISSAVLYGNGKVSGSVSGSSRVDSVQILKVTKIKERRHSDVVTAGVILSPILILVILKSIALH